LQPWHLAYSIRLSHGGLVVVFDIVPSVGRCELGVPARFLFGVVNMVAVVILAVLTIDGFASLWCVYTTVAAGAITLHMRSRRCIGRCRTP
jgi:hypothetical protein